MQDREFFFDEAGDARMESQNHRHWSRMVELVSQAQLAGVVSVKPSLLDVGCNTGGMLHYFQKACFLEKIAGVEPIGRAGDKAIKRLSGHVRQPNPVIYQNLGAVPRESYNLVVSYETLYLINLDFWTQVLWRILEPGGTAFVAFGSHSENTAWRRWAPKLNELFGHKSYIHNPMNVIELGHDVGFDMSFGQLHEEYASAQNYWAPENGWGEFVSMEEALKFPRWKYLFVYRKPE